MSDFEKVSVTVSSMQLATYALRGENPNPVFRSQYGVAHIYPYTLLDDVAATPTEKSYRTLVLENRYLRVTVIPDLGGRVYAVYDKISEREVFYKNSIVKFSPLAIRGAFFSGGVEFSFPVAHAPTTADPVNWEIREHEDGSASVTIGGLEHLSRLRWMITLTLFPDRCALAQDVQLYNPTNIPGRYHYWTNASLDADDQTEFVYPFRRVRSYEFAGTASWPYARLDLVLNDPGLPGMEGVPMWPAERMRQPINFRQQKNMLAQVSIFGRDVSWDWFGAWRHSVNHGYAHFADHRDVSGMKLWSWGNAGVGVVNQTALTDDGSLYAETQCGAFETQLDFALLPAHKVHKWREWWLPLRGMGGLTCASADAGARIHLAAVDNARLEMRVVVCPARSMPGAKVEVSAAGKVLLRATADITPQAPWQASERIAAAELGNKPLRLVVTDGAGNVALDYTLDRDADPLRPEEPYDKSSPQTAEDYYQLGLKYENFDNREQALRAYAEAIQRSRRHSQAHFRLGLMLLRAADFSAADTHLRRARMHGILEANYYLALVAIYSGRREIAERMLAEIPGHNALYSAALLARGTLAFYKREWQRAVDLFEESAALEGKEAISAHLLLAIALIRQGRIDEARSQLLGVLAVDPLNHPALRELSLLDGEPYLSKLKLLLHDDRQYLLDLACFYFNAGLLGDGLIILQEAWLEWNYPMVAYLAGWIEGELGDKEAAGAWLQKAGQAAPDYCFPSRLEEIIALQFALRANAQDHNACYYLGNFLYARQRYEEAVELWLKALPGMESFDVIYRNLGLAAWQRQGDLPKAVELLEKALQLNPGNQDLYLLLDDLYKNLKTPDRRASLLKAVEGLPDVREDVRKRRIMMLVDLGRYNDALSIMQTEKFIPLEMDQSFHDLYVRALSHRAADALQDGKVEDAIRDYQEALSYPENLGVGAPTTLSQADIYYHLGLAYEQAGRYSEALTAWKCAASEHHAHGSRLFEYIQKALDKLSRYSELGLEV
jgi:tetratricopeptide (TPR) repeat protein